MVFDLKWPKFLSAGLGRAPGPAAAATPAAERRPTPGSARGVHFLDRYSVTKQLQILGGALLLLMLIIAVVVYRDKVRMRGALPNVAPLVPAHPLSLAERRAVLNFAERYALLTEERADEVAAHAAPLVGNNKAPARVILGIANHHNR